MDSGCPIGGILKLLELIEEHPAEFAYDFRSRFGLSIDDIGSSVSWREAVLLTAVLLREPDSWLQAVVNEWRFPVSKEWIMLVQQFDAFLAANSKHPKPTPMPWQAPIRSGKPTLPQEQVRAILDAMRPKGA